MCVHNFVIINMASANDVVRLLNKLRIVVGKLFCCLKFFDFIQDSLSKNTNLMPLPHFIKSISVNGMEEKSQNNKEYFNGT